MYKSIVLASCLFGSVYLCSVSLKLINKAHLENKLIVINILTFMMTGSIVAYTFYVSYFKSLTL